MKFKINFYYSSVSFGIKNNLKGQNLLPYEVYSDFLFQYFDTIKNVSIMDLVVPVIKLLGGIHYTKPCIFSQFDECKKMIFYD